MQRLKNWARIGTGHADNATAARSGARLSVVDTILGEVSAMNLDTIEREVRHPYVLVVFPCDENRGDLLKAIAEAGSVPLICHSFEEAQQVMKYEHIQIIICEDHLPREAVQAILKLAKHRRRPIPVVISSRTGEWEEFLKALGQGAFDYLALPPKPGEVRRVLELARAESRQVRAGDTAPGGPPQFCTEEFVLGLCERKFEHAAFANAKTSANLGPRSSCNVTLR